MSPQEALAAVQGGAVVMDLRPPKPFWVGHAPGAVNIQFTREDLGIRAQLSLPTDVPWVVIADVDVVAKHAVEQLEEMGFAVAGFVAGGWRAWKAAGLPVESAPLLTVEDVAGGRNRLHVVDAREDYEYRAARVPGALHCDWTETWRRAAELPGDRPLAVICGDQVRSSLAASVLRRHGLDARLVFGGMNDWYERQYELERG